MSDNIQESDMEGILSSIKNILEEDEKIQQANNTFETSATNNVADNVSFEQSPEEVIELSPDMRINNFDDIDANNDESVIVEALPVSEAEVVPTADEFAPVVERNDPVVESLIHVEDNTVAENNASVNEPFFETDVVEEITQSNEPFFETSSNDASIDELLNDGPTFDVIADVFESDATSANEPSLDELLGTEEVIPAVEELAPVAEEVVPAVEELAPMAEEVVPAVEELAPMAEEVIPAVEELAPMAEEVVPAVEELAPMVEEVVPAVEELAPMAEEVVPAVEELAPMVEEVVPAVEELAPMAEEVIPAVEEIAPVAEEVIPAVEELAPVAEENIAVLDPVIEVADVMEDDAEEKQDVSSNIMSNFAKMFSHEENTEDAQITSAGNTSKTLEDLVVDAIQKAIGKEISAKWNNGGDFNSFVEAEIRRQVETWIANNMNNVIENIVKKEVERVIAKVGS